MEIIRNETGRFEDLGTLKGFSMEANSEEYGTLVMALQTAIETYEKNGWTEHHDSLGETYVRMKKAYEEMADYKNHPRTFNGKKVTQ